MLVKAVIIALGTGVIVSLLWWCLQALRSEDYPVAEQLWYQSYVSDNPSLSGRNDAEWARILRERVAEYLEDGGVLPGSALDLRFAYREPNLIVRFRLSETNMRHFLSDKTRVEASVASKNLKRLYVGDGSDKLFADNTPFGHEFDYLGYMDEEGFRDFYLRLGWFPPAPDELPHYALYAGRYKFDTQGGRTTGDWYPLLVDKRSGTVYLLVVK